MPSSLLFSAPSCRNNDECTAGLFCGGVRTTVTRPGPWCGYSPLPSRGAFDPHRRLAAGMPEHVWVDLEAKLGFVTGTREEFGEARRAHGPPRFDKNTNEARLMLRLPQCWFNPRCRGGEHTAEEAWSCNRSLGSD